MLTPDPLFFFFTLSLSYNKLPEASIRFLPCACAPFPRAKAAAPCCPFHPISLLLRKETGWSPKETRFWRWAEPDNDSDARAVDWPRKAAITNPVRPRRRQPLRHPPAPSPSRAKMSKDNRGSSAHADGGAAEVKKGAFLWRLDTVSLGKHQRNGVEWQDRATTTSQRIGAHVPAPDKHQPRPKSGEERPDYRPAALTRMVEPPR